MSTIYFFCGCYSFLWVADIRESIMHAFLVWFLPVRGEPLTPAQLMTYATGQKLASVSVFLSQMSYFWVWEIWRTVLSLGRHAQKNEPRPLACTEQSHFSAIWKPFSVVLTVHNRQTSNSLKNVVFSEKLFKPSRVYHSRHSYVNHHASVSYINISVMLDERFDNSMVHPWAVVFSGRHTDPCE